MSVKQLIHMSNFYGKNEDYVLAGGGNTSWKDKGVIYVKGSGTALGSITECGFVKMNVNMLLGMLEKPYSKEDDQREAEALADMMAARLPGEEAKRPSVECILHALFPWKFVLHLHPALVNGLSCSQEGESACWRILGEDVVWIPLTKPGYVLSQVCWQAFQRFQKEKGKAVQTVVLQNHGIFVAADTVEEIDEIMAEVMSKLAVQVKDTPDFTPVEAGTATQLAPALRMLYEAREGSAIAVCCATKQGIEFSRSDETMAPLLLPFTPDHIVYCKAIPLYIKEGEKPEEAFEAFVKVNGYTPKIAVVQGAGFFALGKNKKEADIARALFVDAMKIAVYSQYFGGPLNLHGEFVKFILNWEFENYRQKVALTGGSAKRMEGKICLVTGAAQGFGAGIAEALAQQGAFVAAADMNLAGVEGLCALLNQKYGAGTAMALKVNVSNEASVKKMVEDTVLAYGGLDVMVACAGIAIAGDLTEMTVESFDKVTAVNYTGYFLCAKYASIPMKIQRQYAPNRWMDIIEINSKSGLQGSNKNFAYAGSKFGGVGLTQSFAMELVEHGIKVNAVCPGNLLDGPLWSDPEKGLFRQYLEAGKVPGAKTLEDVRRFYEAKVPMNRGCTTQDVARAIFYLVEQLYETGQALPVTGGQVMLK